MFVSQTINFFVLYQCYIAISAHVNRALHSPIQVMACHQNPTDISILKPQTIETFLGNIKS